MTFQSNKCFLTVLLVCLLAAVAWSQASTSRIEGTVVDSSGAVVPKAAVKVTNEDSGVSFEALVSN